MSTIKTLIEKYFDAFNKKDLSAMGSLLSDDVRHDINQGSTEVGKSEYINFMTDLFKNYHEDISNICIMENGSRATAECICSGTYLITQEGLPEAKGQKYSLPVAAIFEEKNGKITRVTSYYNLTQWIKLVSA